MRITRIMYVADLSVAYRFAAPLHSAQLVPRATESPRSDRPPLLMRRRESPRSGRPSLLMRRLTGPSS